MLVFVGVCVGRCGWFVSVFGVIWDATRRCFGDACCCSRVCFCFDWVICCIMVGIC